MASTEFHALMEHARAGFADPADDWKQAREKLLAVHGHPIRRDVRVERGELAGVPIARVETPETECDDRLLVHVHGGAFVSCGVDDYLFYAEALSRAFGVPVLEIGYRLAPEHRFPAALDDCVDVVRALFAAGTSPERTALAGDSCGGALAVACALRLRDAGEPLPSCVLSLSGWHDLEAAGGAAHPHEGLDPFLDLAWLRARGRDYVGPAGDPAHPLASPVHADLAGLPPLLVQVGEVDGTREDGVSLATRAARAGVDTVLEVFPEMIHGFHGLFHLPESRRAFAHATAFFDRCTTSANASA